MIRKRKHPFAVKLELFILCDAATDWMGKLNVLGTFDTISARTLPVVHPQCAVTARLRFERTERGEHQVRINIVDADGQRIVPSLGAALRANFPDAISSHAFNLIVNLQQLKFDRAGEYAIDLAIDGTQLASLPLFVREIAAPAARMGG